MKKRSKLKVEIGRFIGSLLGGVSGAFLFTFVLYIYGELLFTNERYDLLGNLKLILMVIIIIIGYIGIVTLGSLLGGRLVVNKLGKLRKKLKIPLSSKRDLVILHWIQKIILGLIAINIAWNAFFPDPYYDNLEVLLNIIGFLFFGSGFFLLFSAMSVAADKTKVAEVSWIQRIVLSLTAFTISVLIVNIEYSYEFQVTDFFKIIGTVTFSSGIFFLLRKFHIKATKTKPQRRFSRKQVEKAIIGGVLGGSIVTILSFGMFSLVKKEMLTDTVLEYWYRFAEGYPFSEEITLNPLLSSFEKDSEADTSKELQWINFEKEIEVLSQITFDEYGSTNLEGIFKNLVFVFQQVSTKSLNSKKKDGDETDGTIGKWYGQGIMISSEGHMIVPEHVIGSNKMKFLYLIDHKIMTNSDSIYEIEHVLAISEENDLALVKTSYRNEKFNPPAFLTSDHIERKKKYMIIGNILQKKYSKKDVEINFERYYSHGLAVRIEQKKSLSLIAHAQGGFSGSVISDSYGNIYGIAVRSNHEQTIATTSDIIKAMIDLYLEQIRYL
jgi:hypothetical protein